MNASIAVPGWRTTICLILLEPNHRMKILSDAGNVAFVTRRMSSWRNSGKLSRPHHVQYEFTILRRVLNVNFSSSLVAKTKLIIIIIIWRPNHLLKPLVYPQITQGTPLIRQLQAVSKDNCKFQNVQLENRDNKYFFCKALQRSSFQGQFPYSNYLRHNFFRLQTTFRVPPCFSCLQ